MPYLIGTLERHHSSLLDNNEVMYEAHISLELKKEDLIKAKQDDSYQVINLTTQEYYNPEKNCWEKFKVKN